MENSSSLDFRKRVLRSYRASDSVIDELLEYNKNVFDHTFFESGISLPLKDEPFVSFWKGYAEEAREIGAFNSLRKGLIQFNFPIKEGISQTDEYKYAIGKGILGEIIKEKSGLKLKSPERLELFLHQTPAGKIPIIVAHERDDFVSLIRALTLKCEPREVPSSMGAAMIAGYNNWDRIFKLKEKFKNENPLTYSEDRWNKEFSRIIPRKHLYQDKFIILSNNYYSGVEPEKLGLEENDWKDKSIVIRREHECTHYFTKRIFSSMRNNILDEIIADFAGITASLGRYSTDWFLHFVGLENFPEYRLGGRLENYKGEPPLSDSAFKILQNLVFQASKNLELFDRKYSKSLQKKKKRISLLVSLSYFTLEELASEKALEFIENRYYIY